MSGSSKPSLLFVDHDFHRKTRSFHFLIDILEQDFDLTIKYIDPTSTQDLDDLIDDSEYVVLAQMDFLTPHFIAAGKKVCVVQMYDGSAGLPDSHWKMNRQARYLNFSVNLHARALAAGAESLLVRYFPDPSKFHPVEDFSNMRGFFWQRLPNSPVNLATVARMAGEHLDQLHVHTPADDGTPFDPAALEPFNCTATTSDWFEKHEDFKAVLDEANIYFAPRIAEGIGHGFLEALAKGMVVIAFDQPTHSEYINNWVTGILYNQNVGELAFRDWQEDAQRLSRNARAMMATGFERWQASHKDITAFVKAAPAPRLPAIPGLKHALKEIEQGYIAGLPAYNKALDKFALLRDAMSSWDKLEDEVSHAAPAQQAHRPSGIHLFVGRGNARPFLTEGWSDSELTHTWAIAQQAEIKLPVLREATISRLNLDIRALRQNTLSIAINGMPIGEAPIDGNFEMVSFDLDEALSLQPGDTLQISFQTVEKEEPVHGDPRPMQFALKALSVEAAP